MNEKEIKRIIKNKADEKTIPDVSFLIKEKLAKNNMINDQQPSKRRLSLRPLYMSLAFAVLVVFVVVFSLKSPTSTNNIDLFADAEFSDNVLLSAISTSELAYINNETTNNLEHLPILVSTNPYYNLEVPSADLNEYVEDEIDEVMKYSEFIEIFFNNINSFQKEKKEESYLNYQKVITYELNNIKDQIIKYKLHYNETVDEENNTYIINGLLKYGKREYEITIKGTLEEDSFEIIHVINDNKTLRVNYNNNQISILEYVNEQITNQSNIELNEDQVTLSFIKGKNQGVYQFKMVKENEQKRIKANYRIGNSDQGEIDYAVSDEDDSQYDVNLKPKDRPNSEIKKNRRQKGKNSHNNGNDSGDGNSNNPDKPGNPNNPKGPKGPRNSRNNKNK